MSAIDKYKIDTSNFNKLKNELDSEPKNIKHWSVDVASYPCHGTSGYPKLGIYITYIPAIHDWRKVLIEKMASHLENIIPDLIEKSLKDIEIELSASKQAAQDEAIAFLKGE